MAAKQKGQSAMELIILLGVSLVALLVILGFSTTSVSDFNEEQLISTAETSVQDLSQAARDVYLQGPGARKRVYYVVPKNLDQSRSGIEGQSFVLNVLDSDIHESAGVPLAGAIPLEEGGHWVWLESKVGYVVIGAEAISATPGVVYLTMRPDANETTTLTISNEGASAAQIDITRNWSSSTVSLALSENSFLVDAGADKVIQLDFQTQESSAGIHTGSLEIKAVFPDDNESITVPVVVEVVGAILEPAPGTLLIFPGDRELTLNPSGVDANTLAVCNASSLSQENVTLTASGSSAPWISAIDPIPTLDAASCEIRAYTLSVPLATVPGLYPSDITVSAGALSDKMDINLQVASMESQFFFTWQGTQYLGGNKIVGAWTVKNLGASIIRITRMRVSRWSETDQQNAKLTRIDIDSNVVWSGSNDDGEWADITDYHIHADENFSAGNELRFSGNVRDDGEVFVIDYEFSDGSVFTTKVWPDTVTADLCEHASDLNQPVDFSTDINSAANTFGRLSGNDCWDWEQDVYSAGDTCAAFNADPDDDNSISDSTVGADDELTINIGGYDDLSNNCDDGGADASGAYGLEFTITQEMLDTLQAGGAAILSFDWGFTDHGLDSQEEAWVKARFISPTAITYLGSDLDAGDNAADANNEIYWANNPSNTSDSFSEDVNALITQAGTYYLELGGKVDNWGDDEWLEASFDNVQFVVSE